MELDKAIQGRKSVRKYKNKKPDWRDIIECIDSARYVPLAGGIYSLKFIVIDDEKTIQKIADAAQQDFITEVKYVLVICSNAMRTIRNYEDKGEIYVRQQAGAAIQNILLKIEEKGLSTCWIGYFIEEQIKKILKIPEKVQIEALLPIGYEFRKEKPKKKIELDNILYFYKYENKQMKKISKLDI
jgi:nitroreductase